MSRMSPVKSPEHKRAKGDDQELLDDDDTTDAPRWAANFKSEIMSGLAQVVQSEMAPIKHKSAS